MDLIIIHERDHDDKEDSVIGVADCVENAEIMITEYYGKENYKEISFRDIRDSNLEYSKVLEVQSDVLLRDSSYKVTVTLAWFKLNEI